ncbi:MAG: histidine triad nucleotide-binding protein [Spongiibacteraceae bacterium]|jgi:histidine triad (HIT) family protein|nr:histidine triad nucleotide-binding protein [Spongiibacteraceae bacterium]
MTADCLFCKIANDQLPATRVYEDDTVIAFRDINPQAPLHVLIVPRRHITTTNDLTPDDGPLLAAIFNVARKIAADEGVAESGYRLVFNCNSDGGQSVYHIHLHLLAGRPLAWPPG